MKHSEPGGCDDACWIPRREWVDAHAANDTHALKMAAGRLAGAAIGAAMALLLALLADDAKDAN
jgi:hypothetical protein